MKTLTTERNHRTPLDMHMHLSRVTGGLCLASIAAISLTGSVSEDIHKSYDRPAPIPVASDSYASTPSRPSPSSTAEVSSALTPVPVPSETQLELRECKMGIPVSFSWPAVGIEPTEIEHIGLDERGNLGSPSDKTKVGWYMYGPKPGESRGNTITDAHWYDNDTAVVKNDFRQRVGAAVGSIISLEMDNGSTCNYQVEWQVTVDKFDEENGFPALVKRENLYDHTSQRFENLVFMTCDGEWNWVGTSQDEIVVLAVPIN